MKLGSLFDGLGGFPRAGLKHGFEPVLASEIESFPIAVTTKRFPNMEHLGDITKINGAEIEPVELITGGSPCQDLSVAGKREGLAGARSGLFMDQIRIIKEMRERDKEDGRTGKSIRPRFFVWENVPGAFSSNGGEDFRAVIEETARVTDETIAIPRPFCDEWNPSGTVVGRDFSISWRTLDAQYWGVPQRRRRIFLVADFAGQCSTEIFFESESLPRDTPESEEQGQGTSGDVEGGIGKTIFDMTHGDDVMRDCGQIVPTLQSRMGTGGNQIPVLLDLEEEPLKMYDIGDRRSVANESVGVAPTLTSKMGTGGNNVPAFVDPQKPKVGSFYPQMKAESQCFRNDDVSVTLVNGTNPGWQVGIVQEATPVEKGFRMVAFGEYADDDTASAMKARDYKDATDLVVQEEAYGIDCRNATENKELSATLQAKPGGGFSYNCIHPVRINYTVRRLTPVECLRLQGYPDWWLDDVEGNSDSASYKAIGNGMAQPCPDFIIEAIARAIQKESLPNK